MARQFDLEHNETPETVLRPNGVLDGDILVSAPIEISDAKLLFSADFERAGPDLLLVNEGQPTIRIVGYFKTSEPADLVSPEGSVLAGDLVELLAGPAFPGQVAQGAPGLAAAAGNAIGQVETVAGAAFVQRTDGTTVPLTLKTKVFQNDVVRTEAGGSLSIAFEDGTIFTLAASSRMVLNELIYNPASSSNSAVFNLVEGSFVFIAGQVAKTGGMEVKTPAATMGIRGTTVGVEITTVNGITRVEVTLNRDPDGDVGQFQITRLDGTVIADIVSTETKWIISPVEGETREILRTIDDLNSDQVLITRAFAAFESANLRVNQGGNYVERDAGDEPQGPGTLPDDDGEQDPDQRGDLGSSGLGTQLASDELGGSTAGDVQISELGGQGNDALGRSGATVGARGEIGGPRDNVSGSDDDDVVLTSTPDGDGDQPEGGNTAPELTLSGGSFTVPEDGSVTLNGFAISDPQNNNLTATLEAGSTVTLNPGSGVTILEGTGVNDERVVIQGTGAQITAALNGIIYNPSPNADSQGTLSITITDGQLQTSATMVIEILALPDAPIAVPDAVVRTDTSPLLVGNLISNDIDPDITPNPDLLEVVEASDGATTPIFIPSGGSGTLFLLGGGNVTIFSNGTYSFDPAGAYASLTAGATAVETITYVLSDNTLDEFGNPRTSTSTFTITIEGTDDAPVVSGSLVVNVGEGAAIPLTTADFTAVDPDTSAGSLVYTITSSPVDGFIAFNSAPTVAITTFTQADLAAGNLRYEDTSETGGTDTFSFTVTDGTTPVNGSVTINVGGVNDDPSGTGFPTSISGTEDQPLGLDFSSVVLSDVDAGTGTLIVTVSSLDGIFSGSAAPGVTSTYAGNFMTAQGSLADLNVFFATPNLIQYTPSLDDSGTPADTITVTINDNGNSGAGGGGNITLATIPINITPVNDAPAINLISTTLSANYEENDAGVLLPNPFSYTDVDDTNLESATVSISTNFAAGDTLSFTDTAAITGSYSAATGVLTLTGSASLADYQAAIGSITFSTPGDTPSELTRTVSIVVNDGDDASNAETVSITVQAINDEPVISGFPTTFAVTEDSATTFDLTNFSFTDADADQFSDNAEVTLTTDLGSFGTMPTDPNVTITVNSPQSITFTGTAYNIGVYFATNGNVPFTPPADSNASGTITINVNDLGNTGATPTGPSPGTGSANVAFTIAPVDDPTVVTTSSGSVAYAEGPTPTIVDAALTVTDVDTPNLLSATASITGNFDATGDQLSLGGTTALTGSYDALNGIFTLSGSGTLAEYESALRSIQFSSISENPSSLDRTIEFVVTDGTTPSTGVSRTVTVQSVNDAPILAGVPTTFTAIEDTATTFDLTALNLTDVDANGGDVTVRLATNNSTFAPIADATITIDATDPTLVTFTGTISNLEAYFAAKGNVPFTPDPGYNGAVTITVRLSDNGNSGDIGGTLFDVQDVNFTVTPVDDPSVVTLGGTVPAFTEGDPAIFVSDDVTITDSDSTMLTGATVTITTGRLISDVLGFIDRGPITGAYQPLTGTLTLTGTDTLANYEAALETVRFLNSTDAPGSQDRTIEVQVSNGSVSSTVVTRVISVTDVNDAPVITFDTAPLLDVTEDTPTAIVPVNFSLSDTDAGAATLVNLDVTSDDGALAFNNLTGSGVAIATTLSSGARLEGTLADLEAYVQGGNVELTPLLNAAGNDRVFFTLSDLGNTGTGGVLTDSDSIGINLVPVNDAPVVTTTAGTVAYTENDAATVVDNAITISDIDNATLSGATVTIGTNFQVGADVLSATVIGGITAGYNAASGVLTLSGNSSVANYQTVLRSVTYENTSEAPTEPLRNIDFVVDDGTDSSVVATRLVDPTGVNDAPVLTAPSSQTVVEDTNTIIDLSTLVLTDPDSGPDNVTVNINPTGGILTLPNGSTALVTVTVLGFGFNLVGTVSDVQAYLQTSGNVAFNPDFNSTTAGSIALFVTDNGNNGSGTAQSASDTITINITPVDDPTVVTTQAGTVNFNEGDPAVVIDNLITLNDVDSTTLTGATVQIGSNFQLGADFLAATDSGGITSSYNTTSGVLSLTGNATLAQYQTVLRTVTYENTSSTPTEPPRQIRFSVANGATNSNVATRDVDPADINNAPVLASIGGTEAFAEGDTPFNLSPALVLTDADSTNLSSATVQITGNYENGSDVLSASGLAASLTGFWNAANGTLSITGAGTVAEYQAALRSVTFETTSENPTVLDRTIAYTASDGTNTSTMPTQTVTVSAVNDAPTINATVAPTTAEDTPVAISFASAVQFELEDVDAGIQDVTLSVSSTNGDLALGASAAVTIVPDGSGGGTITGNIGSVRAYILGGNVTFTPDADFSGAAVVTYSVSDNGNTGTGGALVASDTISINVTPVNDAPSVTLSNVTLANDLITNGGFEQGPTGGQFTQVNAGSTAITNWTVGLSSVDHYHGTRENAEGIAHLDLNGLGQGSVSQDIATIIGETYEVTFNMARAPVGFPPDDLRLTIGGVGQDFTYSTAGSTETNMQWEERSTFFTATATTTTVTFQTLELGNSGPSLDNVSVQQTIGAGTTVQASEETPVFINNIEVADIDTAGPITVVLSVANGVLSVNETAAGGLLSSDVTGNSSGSVTLIGTTAAINATLGSFEGLSYTGNFNYFGLDTLTIGTDDGAGGTSAASLNISVADVSDAPPALSSLGDVAAGNVANLDGIQFVDAAGSNVGQSVAGIGDINNDGYQDFAIGGPDTTTSGGITGSTAIILGGPGDNPFRAGANANGEVALPTLTASTGGFEFIGGAGDRNGFAVNGGGDVNGDGIDDFVITEVFDDGGNTNAGKAFVVFGGQNFNSFTNGAGEISTSQIGVPAGLQGFALQAGNLNQNLGSSVSISGDINFDGIDDILVGAPTSTTGVRGNAYLLYGGQDFATIAGVDGTIELVQDRLPLGAEGFQLFGENTSDRAGTSVDFVGDVNNDGIDDIAIGSIQNNNGGANFRGAVHVIYGGQDFDTLSGGVSGKEIGLVSVGSTVQGYQINGNEDFRQLGTEVGGQIDFNNDGIEDLLFSQPLGAFGSSFSYVLFGGQAVPSTFSVDDIGSTYGGLKLQSASSTDQADQIANAGDVNGDGIDDLIVGAPFNDQGGSDVGRSYVLFGGSGLTGTVNVGSAATGTNGFIIQGEAAQDKSGTSVSGVGDINGDGFDDFLIGAIGNDDGASNAGAAYLVYGGDFGGLQRQAGTAGNDTVNGSAGADFILGQAGNDFLFGNGGADALDGGLGNDILYANDTSFQRIDGGAGQDGLTFTDGGAIDLTNVGNDKIQNIENLSITSVGATSIRLGLDDVFAMGGTGNASLETNLSDTLPNSLQIFANSTDTIFLENNSTGGWVVNPTKSLLMTSLDVVEFIQGGSGDVLATLGVSDDATLTIVT